MKLTVSELDNAWPEHNYHDGGDLGYASLSSSQPSRFILASANRAGLCAVAKSSPQQDLGIHREASFYERRFEFRAFAVPRVNSVTLDNISFISLEAMAGNPVTNDEVVLPVLNDLRNSNLTHGDFAPWNILDTPTNPTVLDWEGWSGEYVPYWDLFTFEYRKLRLLDNGSPDELVQRITSCCGLRAAFTRLTGDEDWRSAFKEFVHHAPYESRADTEHFRRHLRRLIAHA